METLEIAKLFILTGIFLIETLFLWMIMLYTIKFLKEKCIQQ